MTIREALAEGKRLLAVPSPSCFIDTPSLDASLLLAEILQKSRTEIIVRANETLPAGDSQKFFRLLERRRNGECIAYILGRKEFRGLEFTVNPGVLVPRPDTETLVETALEYIDSMIKQRGGGTLSLLDLCTGSGALAISLKSERPFLETAASDISPGALETANCNANRLLGGGPGAVRFIRSDLFENIDGKFDIIVSNPPYIPSGRIDTLAPEVRREPRLALDGGGDGLVLIKKIAADAAEYLVPGGVLLLEAGSEQMPAIRSLLEAHGFGGISVRKDLSGQERVIGGKTAVS